MSIATVDLRHYCERLGDILLHVSKVMGGARCPDDTERTDRVARPSLPFQFRVESPNYSTSWIKRSVPNKRISITIRFDKQYCHS
mmetsp:Transcript_57147/g.66802  ORF Transcript_57147/g.66802 Transcript_57147/m.66802 type:complete len:85 (+) Transcript_57147:253-507(+)